ncbi:hypothetical protein [Allochromatium palmeri]|nr:hypothetical protein [Allochromatium palmeri]
MQDDHEDHLHDDHVIADHEDHLHDDLDLTGRMTTRIIYMMTWI